MNRPSRLTAGMGIAALALAWGNVAQAETEGWYFGVSGGLTMADMSKSDLDQDFVDIFAAALDEAFGISADAAFVDSTLDDNDKGWGIHIGYRINRWVAAEVGYYNLGEFNYVSQVQLQDDGEVFIFDADARLTSQGPFAAVLAMFPSASVSTCTRAAEFCSPTRVFAFARSWSSRTFRSRSSPSSSTTATRISSPAWAGPGTSTTATRCESSIRSSSTSAATTSASRTST